MEAQVGGTAACSNQPDHLVCPNRVRCQVVTENTGEAKGRSTRTPGRYSRYGNSRIPKFPTLAE